MSRPTPAARRAQVHAALGSPTRRRLLELLRESDAPRDAHDLADAVGLHLTTVRFHLEVLREAHLVVRRAHPQRGVGRPRTAYAPVSVGPAGEGEGNSYEGLVSVLADQLADTVAGRADKAEQAGLAWADQLVPATQGAGRGVDEAAREVSGVFAEMGFEPDLTSIASGWQIALHACPFRAVARAHPEVVCAVHLGLLRGSLHRLGVSTSSRLMPFVEPELCLVQVQQASESTPHRARPSD